MSIKRHSLFVLVQIVAVISLYGQAPQISHYMFNTPMFNPGSTGFTNSIVASGIHRQQWYGFEGRPQQTHISVDAPIRAIRSGVGVNIFNDQIGFFNNTTIQLAYSYQIPFLDGLLGMGINFGINSMGLRMSDVITPDGQRGSGDPALDNVRDASSILFDVGVGFFFAVRDRYEIGISLGHLNQPIFDDIGFNREAGRYYVYRQSRTVNLSGSYNFSLDAFPRIDFVPSALVKSDFTSVQVDISLVGLYNRMFWGGITYRFGDAVILLAGLHLQQFPMQVGIAYDLATNWMFRGSKIGGSFEIFARYSFNISADRVPQSHRNSRFL